MSVKTAWSRAFCSVLRLVFLGRISTSSGVSACLYLSQYLDKNSLALCNMPLLPMINSFDSMPERPFEIICLASVNCEVQVFEILVYNNPFSFELFKPPFKI